jgi:hypothetical protein
VDPRALALPELAWDPVLTGLVSAQVSWLSTHDAAALRRHLVALLSQLV